MKIIVQWMPDEIETALYELDKENFVVDVDTYIYFYEEVFWKGIQEFVERKYKIKFKPVRGVQGAEAVENLYYDQDIISKYWRKYNKIRDKFYLYKNSIYSYIPMGFMNVGHEIEIYRYDAPDLVNLLNKQTERKGFLRKLL